MAGSFTPKDFDTSANRKVMLEQGAGTKDNSETVIKSVEDALERQGL